MDVSLQLVSFGLQDYAQVQPDPDQELESKAKDLTLQASVTILIIRSHISLIRIPALAGKNAAGQGKA